MSTRAAEVGTTVATSSEDSLVAAEPVKGTIFHVKGNDTNTFAVLHDQVEGEVFDEEVGIVAEGLAIEGVENGMTSTVSSSSAAVGLTTLAVLEGLTTKGALVNLALLCPRERDTVVFELR